MIASSILRIGPPAAQPLPAPAPRKKREERGTPEFLRMN
jgi:hypothetical protein